MSDSAPATPSARVRALKALYEAILRGDTAAVSAALADDIEWEHGTGADAVPWAMFRQGREAVEAAMRVDTDTAFRFAPVTFFESGRRVTALVEFVLHAAGAAGSPAPEPHTWREAHQWEFGDDGRIVRLRQRGERAATTRGGATLLAFGHRP